MLFSATLNKDVQRLTADYMNDPVSIEIESENITVDRVTQELYHVRDEEKMQLLLGILKKEDVSNAIIFTNTKVVAYEVSKRLEHNGFNCDYIMGDLPQAKRLKVINAIKEGNSEFLVATDVAARGLHINNLQLVINYDIPLDCESYVHRIGRTARTGKEGKAISFACQEYVYGLESIERYIGNKIPVKAITEDLWLEDKS